MCRCGDVRIWQLNRLNSHILTFSHLLIFLYFRAKFVTNGAKKKKIHRVVLVTVPGFYRPPDIRHCGSLGIPYADPPLPGYLLCQGAGHHVK
jgi:hypothetical protein